MVIELAASAFKMNPMLSCSADIHTTRNASPFGLKRATFARFATGKTSAQPKFTVPPACHNTSYAARTFSSSTALAFTEIVLIASKVSRSQPSKLRISNSLLAKTLSFNCRAKSCSPPLDFNKHFPYNPKHVERSGFQGNQSIPISDSL